MPTGDQYRAAAAEFLAVSEELRHVSADLRSVDAPAVVQGGQLGRLVPVRIDSCAGQATLASARAEAAAQVCAERAAIIADYEARLAAYEIALNAYYAQLNASALATSGWGSFFPELDDTVVAAPVQAPLPRRPIPPTPPPSWADVRRLR